MNTSPTKTGTAISRVNRPSPYESPKKKSAQAGKGKDFLGYFLCFV